MSLRSILVQLCSQLQGSQSESHVAPAPRKPLSMVTGTLSSDIAAGRPAAPAPAMLGQTPCAQPKQPVQQSHVA